MRDAISGRLAHFAWKKNTNSLYKENNKHNNADPTEL